jgi:hypothetical protein
MCKANDAESDDVWQELQCKMVNEAHAELRQLTVFFSFCLPLVFLMLLQNSIG